VIIGAAFVLFMVLLLATAADLNRKLQHRSEGLPPAGTAIFIDAKGLSVGAEVFAWPSLAIGSGRASRAPASPPATRPA